MKKMIANGLILLMMFALLGGCAAKIVELHHPESVTSTEYDAQYHADEGVLDVMYLDDGDFIDIAPEMVPLAAAPAVFSIPVPEAPGTSVKKNDKSVIDYSNAKDGYIMAKYIPKSTKNIKIIIKGPSDAQYQYSLKSGDVYEVYPLSDGNGKYTVGVYEQVDGSKYATVVSATVDVKLSDEFAPFIRPNQYVNYNKDSQTVKKAAELVKGKDTTLDKLAAVYNHVIKNLTYDKEKAKNVKSGYLPDVDEILKAGKGICFDYAAVMAVMLRSQDIPTKLVVGYTGDVYHAWLTVYSKETGWIDSVVQFDGKTWKLMDPTFASTGNQSSDTMQYIGDGKNYTAKFLY
ncbi:MAG: transglutaminase-like domain-containing protein [Oscillospiraceae bacterium]|nr:transglutaminase-like domain-containing protein [Oscillospiraceae bacterium]